MKRILILSLFAISILAACSSNTTPPPGSAPPDSLIHVDFPGNSDGQGNADSAHANHGKDK